MQPAHPTPRLRVRALALSAALWLLLAGGCRADAAGSLVVFAAASLTAPFEELVAAFASTRPGIAVELHCAGTPQLVLQLREGARADVFASADDAQMQRAVDAGLLASEPVVFAHNRLAIVTPRGNPAGVRSLADLGAPDRRVLLCGPDVPAGRYARAALARAGVAARSLSDEPSVLAVLSKVGLGLVDAGVVYATDAARAPDTVELVPIPAEANVTARYPIAAVGDGPARPAATAFVAFVRSEPGRRILSRHGFELP